MLIKFLILISKVYLPILLVAVMLARVTNMASTEYYEVSPRTKTKFQ